MGKIKLKKRLNDTLYELYKQGVRQPKNAKNQFNATPYIHSNVTFRTYKQQVKNFCNYMSNEKGITENLKSEDLKVYVCEYLTKLQEDGKSAWTVSTALCAIAKAMKLRTTDFNITIQKRHRADVFRSRLETDTDKHISKTHNKAIIEFCKCTGLRRHEVEALRREDIIYHLDSIYINVPQGKGGKQRMVIFFGTDSQKYAFKRLIEDKEGIIFEKIPKALDIHSYRAVYACRMYKAFARTEIPDADRYICRKDKKGVIYDKLAMKKVSQMLGHNRLDVIANSYLHGM